MGARRHHDPMSRPTHDERRTPPPSGKRTRAALLAAALASAALAIPAGPANAGLIPGFSYNRPVEVTNTSTGLRADVMWAGTASYTGVFLWPDNASRSQEFDAIRAGDAFQLRARHSRLCLALDSRERTFRNGTAVVQRPCGPASSYWRVRTVGNRVTCDGDSCTTSSAVYPTLQNLYTRKCLDARNPAGGNPPSRAVLQQWTCIGTADDWNARNQMFSVANVR